ncbi:MAG: hypothetical protein D6768_14840 [Chloroflexi bacterium]|nr:MAG: hypothetical protein D6768_14840 [Chloroflexota bacterium]
MMAELQVVGLGLTALDVLIRLTDMPTWEHRTPFCNFGFDGGGPAGTATVAMARLGARVGFVGTVGNDQLGELKLQSLRQAGVDLSRMVYRNAPEDQIVFVFVHAQTGERVFNTLENIRKSPLKIEELDKDYITSAQYLHLDGFHPEASLQAARWMREAGKTVVLDGSKTDGKPIRPHLIPLIEYVDVLICGSGFAQLLTGKSDTWEACAAVLDRGPSIVVQTEGEAGSFTVTREQQFHTPPFTNIDVVDTTGAGDVFHGAYIVGLLKGWDLRTIATFCTAVSALECTKLGGRRAIPTYDEVISFLAEQGISLS